MAKKNGVRLFTGFQKLNSWFEQLELMLHRHCELLFNEGPLNAAELRQALFDKFLLEQPGLGVITKLLVRSYSETYRDRSKGDQKGYLAEAHLPYHGSHVLLRTAPEPGYTFTYHGLIGKETLKLRTFVPSLDLAPFLAAASAEVERTRAALHASHSSVQEYNNRIRAEIELMVRTF